MRKFVLKVRLGIVMSLTYACWLPCYIVNINWRIYGKFVLNLLVSGHLL